jgi:outer membrane protein OmpA-like peptidoglycan-associated protein
MPIDRGEAAIRTSIASATRRTTKFIARDGFPGEPHVESASERTVVMNRLNGALRGILAAGFAGFLSFGSASAGEPLSTQQILDALTAAPKPASPADRLGPTRSPTFSDRDTAVASAPSMPRIDLQVSFDFDSAQITPEAEGQLRELGKALADPKLKGATISINGHTDGKGSDAFNKRLSERRAQSIKTYLVDNFGLTASNLRAVGYGKSRLKNTGDPFAAENRRVEVVNMVSTQAQR